MEFELTLKSLDLLGLENSVRGLSAEDSRLREPRLELGQLVISDKVKRALDMAISQANNSKTLFERWGMQKVLTYGRAVTLLFSGPPGVGKTACAEALAHALGRRLIVADYSRIQSCWVGQTEKNIVRTFVLASKNQAVLFWDEADAMFYDRDAALRSWEVRDVNVLLQAIEKFDGVCILATNRKLSLDPALERRISIKIELERPDREMRKLIWQKHIPAEVPLAEPIDWEVLSRFELTGGEIKNAVLNTARLVLARGSEEKVRMQDFLDAVALETENRWGRGRGNEIGFGKDS
jgi:SpoVK/Ycf46/Vps4 family AAA+-type ATPase